MNADKRRDIELVKSLSVTISVYRRLMIVLFLSYSTVAQAVSNISISAELVESPQGDVKNLALNLNLKNNHPQLKLSATLKQKEAKDWAQFRLNCALPQSLVPGLMQCADGLLKSARVDFPFSLQMNRLSIQNGVDIGAELQLNNASFSDESGLHAADKLNGKLNLALKKSQQVWSWQTSLDWQSGEVFWQPFYLANGGHQLVANGRLEDDLLKVASAQLALKNIGALEASGQMRLSDFKLTQLNADLKNLNLTNAYPLIFKPFLEKTVFNHADILGRASLQVSIENSALNSFNLRLSDVNIIDKNQKFAFYNLSANLPWDYDVPQQVSLRYDHGSLLQLPLGKTNIQAEVNRFSLTAPKIRLPILDGALNLADTSAARIGEQWFWHLSANLEPISMQDFSTQLKLPRMSGKASAHIPLVTYRSGELTTDGSVVLNVFDGSATVTHLTMQTPLGATPKLNADITLRNLDLGDLTRTFSFGAIEGKLDGDVKDLEMQNWKPVKFDAMVQSSPGTYSKKISQRAVENISALGGGGAAVAVQRSFLRFFEQFNYGKMGLSCKLRNDICEMGGVESTPHGYVIVKGSGIPAITVMGYNKTVAWSELLARVKRVIDGNTKAVIQ